MSRYLDVWELEVYNNRFRSFLISNYLVSLAFSRFCKDISQTHRYIRYEFNRKSPTALLYLVNPGLEKIYTKAVPLGRVHYLNFH